MLEAQRNGSGWNHTTSSSLRILYRLHREISSCLPCRRSDVAPSWLMCMMNLLSNATEECTLILYVNKWGGCRLGQTVSCSKPMATNANFIKKIKTSTDFRSCLSITRWGRISVYLKFNEALECYTALEAEKTKRVRKSKELKAFIKTLKQQPLVVDEWNERLWITLLDTATVNRDGSIMFHFKSGVEIMR